MPFIYFMFISVMPTRKFYVHWLPDFSAVKFALSVLRNALLLTLNERGSLRERMVGGVVSLPTAAGTDSVVEIPNRNNPTDTRGTRMVSRTVSRCLPFVIRLWLITFCVGPGRAKAREVQRRGSDWRHQAHFAIFYICDRGEGAMIHRIHPGRERIMEIQCE